MWLIPQLQGSILYGDFRHIWVHFFGTEGYVSLEENIFFYCIIKSFSNRKYRFTNHSEIHMMSKGNILLVAPQNKSKLLSFTPLSQNTK